MMGVIATVSSSRSATGSQNSEDADEETWARLGLAPLMATLLLPIIIGVIVLIKCVFNSCCARRTTTKEEMYGLEGRMTMLPNADASFVSTTSSHQPRERSSSPLTATASLLETSPKILDSTVDNVSSAKVLINNNTTNAPPTGDFYPSGTVTLDPNQVHPHHSADSDLTDTLKRATGKRQLPDLPQIPQQALGHPPRRSSSVLSHDGTSELYATVGEVPNATTRTGVVSPYAHLMNRKSLTNDASVSKPSTSRGVNNEDDRSLHQTKVSIEPTPSSDSETYASSNHPYAKLKRNPAEHPYARVRNASLGNDDETDTDNYDLPQPYAQTRGRPGSVPLAISNIPGSSNQPGGSPNDTNGIPNSDGPVPPRRIGRQWRRGSNSQGQNADAASHFSGDSQDSRGYTSISVREPLSNIRSQIASTRSADSHYATVSDDSEEMYAAIDDSSEGNYMQIPEGASRPSWLDAANVASPIPERREANSPLPPVPAVPPPETPGASSSIIASGSVAPAPTSPSLANQPQGTPPLYAQVTKKSKKGKAPVTPTASNASISSQIAREPELPALENSLPGPLSTSSSTTHHSNSHHHRSKSRTLMDNSNTLEAGLTEPRRWSKADISYSEFEVVREGLPPSESKSPLVMSSSIEWPERTAVSPRESITSKKSLTEDLVDEDNYNVIPDKRNDGRISRSSKHSSMGSKVKSRCEMVDSDNYQEIEPISNTYQEIGGGKEPSDHYQEIGTTSHDLLNGEQEDQGPNALYQVIRKKGEDDYEEDEEDQFYEKVKPTSSKATLSVPGHYLSLEGKHGYEKLKRKGKTVPSPKEKLATSDDDDEDDDDENKGEDENDAMYESVKYPPYERLKESRSDLAVDTAVDDEDGNNFYEHIGYSRVKPKHKRGVEAEEGSSESKKKEKPSKEELDINSSADPGDVDINQLYAVVDKTKKKNKNTSKSSSSNTNSSNASNTNNNNNLPVDAVNNLSTVVRSDGSLTGGSGSERDSTRSTASTFKSGSSKCSKTAGDGTVPSNAGDKRPDLTSMNIGAEADLDYIDDSIDIEYI